MRIRFGLTLKITARTKSYTTGIVLIDKTGKLMREITTLFGVYPQLFHSLYASVAPNTDRFAFVAKGGSDGALGAELFDPDGVSVAKELQVKAWEVLQKSSPAAGLWRIDLSWPKFGPRRYFQLDLVGVPGFLWLSKEKTVMF